MNVHDVASTRSLKSIKTIRTLSAKSFDKPPKSQKKRKSLTGSQFMERDLPIFEEALPLACKKYYCPYNVYVKKEFQQDNFRSIKASEPSVKYKKITMTAPQGLINPVSQVELEKTDDKTTATTNSEVFIDEDGIFATTIYDNANNLTEIILSKIRGLVPRSLIQIIGFLTPVYDNLTKITINCCIINSIIIYELTKIMTLSYITDICLDGSPVREGNYFILLDSKDARIKYLSLCRCKINDVVCKEIAIRLHFLCPAEKNLMLLNLSSNHITDEGAKLLGEALRSNRHLRYLNLADNRIADEGTAYILDILMEFRLTYDESMARKSRLLAYMREKSVLVAKYINECDVKSVDEMSQLSRKSPGKRRRSLIAMKGKAPFKKDHKRDKDDDIMEKAELFALGLLGPLIDPFDTGSIKIRDNDYYSIGNMVLCYLNLSYNRLTYYSVKKLLTVLQYQRLARKASQAALVKIVIEGNPLPTACMEYNNINDLSRLAKSMYHFGGRKSDAGQRKKYSTRISIASNLTGLV